MTTPEIQIKTLTNVFAASLVIILMAMLLLLHMVVQNERQVAALTAGQIRINADQNALNVKLLEFDKHLAGETATARHR